MHQFIPLSSDSLFKLCKRQLLINQLLLLIPKEQRHDFQKDIFSTPQFNVLTLMCISQVQNFLDTSKPQKC